MREPLGWIKRLLRGESNNVIALLTPEAVRSQGAVLRIALAGTTAIGLIAASAIGLFAFTALAAAVGIIYFLATQVLGLKIDVDPRALYEQMRKQGAAAAHYGPN